MDPHVGAVPSVPALIKSSPVLSELLTEILSLIIFVVIPSVRAKRPPPDFPNPSVAVTPLYCENCAQVIFVVLIVIVPLFVHTQPVSAQTVPSLTIQKIPFVKSVPIASVVLCKVKLPPATDCT